METLESKEDFEWYKKKLDVERKYTHEHTGVPKKYPCRVKSSWWDDPNGPYTYDHSFIYKQKVSCESCNSSKEVWPEVSDD